MPLRCRLLRIGGAGEAERPEAGGHGSESKRADAGDHLITSSAGSRSESWTVVLPGKTSAVEWLMLPRF